MPRQAHTPLPQPIFHEPVFAEGHATPDPNGFATAHPSDSALFDRLGDLLKKDVVGFNKSRLSHDAVFPLAEAYGPHGTQVVDKIKAAGKIIFHAFGDSGASNAGKYPNELKVADQVTLDCHQSDEANRPAFIFHLGDIVYNFGEARYYYDQFYEPFRNYPAPIFAIPGNHDSFIVPGTPAPQTPLTTFARNFCAEKPAITPEAGSLHRTAMTQPGVYFALDAPFVRLIGLFSNALEDPGVISSENGKWPHVPDVQLDFLAAQLRRIKQEKYNGAVLLATHHPPFAYSPPPGGHGSGGNHASSSAMLRQIDTICLQEGVYPHAFLSGHVHNYQRYTRIVKFAGKEIDVPFIDCGDGGHNVNAIVRSRRGEPAREPHAGSRVDYLETKPALQAKELLLEKYDDHNYGYLRVHADEEQLRIGFHQVGVRTLAQSRFDMVTVDLASHTMVAN
jgi:hypothetical protein